MKHLVKNSIIFLVDILGVSALYRFFARRQGPLVRVIVFHDVANAVWFEKVIEMLVKRYHLLTPEQFHTKELERDTINVLLTFDDGYQSWIDVCLPILKKHNAKGIFFINSGLLDVAHDREMVAEYMQKRLLISPKQSLSWEGAGKLVQDGHTIGGHTVSHPNLALSSNNEVEQEVVEDKKRIESVLGVTIVDFAYPFGKNAHIPSGKLNYELEASYPFIYSAISNFVRFNNKTINRVCIEKEQSIGSIQKWIRGGYDIFTVLFNKA